MLALAIFGVGTLWIVGFKPLAGRQATYEVWMQGSSGIRRGDRIRVSGIEVGRVKKLDLRPGEEWPVIFDVALDREIAITAGSTARITTDGLLGAPYLEIVTGPADAPPLPAGSRILGREGGTVTHTLEGLGQATDRLPALLDQLSELVGKINEEVDPLMGGLQALLSEKNVEAISGSLAVLRPTLEDIGPKLSTLVTELEEAVHGIPEVTGEFGGLAADLRRALGPDGERLARVLGSTESTLDSAEGALAIVEGNTGELDAMLHDLREAAANLKSLSHTLKERPGLLLRFPRPPERKPGDGAEE